MSDVVIKVEYLSKLYHIGKAQQRHDTLRDAISDVGTRNAECRLMDRWELEGRTKAFALQGRRCSPQGTQREESKKLLASLRSLR